MTAIIDIEGVGAEFARKLKEAGIDVVEELLRDGATPGGRSATARKAGIDEVPGPRVGQPADLMRIKGLGRNSLTCWRPWVWTP